MLRITTDDTPPVLTLRLEGRLAGPWIRVLQECWDRARTHHAGSALRLDLTEITFVDVAGESVLAFLHRQGAELIAADCLTKAIVTEITRKTREN